MRRLAVGCGRGRSLLAHRCGASRGGHSDAATDTAGTNPSLPSWVLCTTVAEAHALCSILVGSAVRSVNRKNHERELSGDLHGVLSRMAEVGQLLTTSLHVPRDVTRMSDLPMFLAETLRPGRLSRSPNRFSQMPEDAILSEFEEWVLSGLPPSERPPPLIGEGAAASPAEVDTMPYAAFLSFVQSYMRYHAGVMWGAPRHGERKPHHHVYHLHPWHGVYCPEGWEQMPYVHTLQWMMMYAAEQPPGGSKEDEEKKLKAYGAAEAFRPPSSAPAGVGRCFTALDVCSQSGFGVDLLLKAGAARVVAVDAAVAALGSTEATVHEHMKEKRSRFLGGAGTGGQLRRREVEVRRCELLPQEDDAVRVEGPADAEGPHAKPSSLAAAAAFFAGAASRRRQLARSFGRAYEQQQEQPSERGPSTAGPYDVLYYHPPVPVVWPLTVLPVSPVADSVWWRIAQEELRRRCPRPNDSSFLLPFLVAPTSGGSSGGASVTAPHPHQSLSTLERFVQRLRQDDASGSAVEREVTGGDPCSRSAKGHSSLLREGGYVVCVLPRSYEPLTDVARFAKAKYGHHLHRSRVDGAGDCLSDYVVAQLDGLYDVVLRRRHLADGRSLSSAVDAAAPLLGCMVVDHGDRPTVTEQARRFFGSQWWIDVLVMKKRGKGRHSPPKVPPRSETSRLHPHLSSLLPGRTPLPLPWEDSFEFNEYKPQSSPRTRYHWTDLVPTYSYLKDDFYEEDTAASLEKNFLALGHPQGGPRGTTAGDVDGAAATAAGGSAGLFAEGLRSRRRRRMRKLAFAPIEQQEWYIDEKLIKSEAAKVSFMNELARWDFKDYDE